MAMVLNLEFDGHALVDLNSSDAVRLRDLLDFWPWDHVRLAGQRVKRRDRADILRRVMTKARRFSVLDPDHYRVLIPVEVAFPTAGMATAYLTASRP